MNQDVKRPSPDMARLVAWSVVGVCLALNTVSVVLTFLAPALGVVPAILFAVVTQAFAVFGAIIASRRPQHRVGWLYLAAGLIAAAGNGSFGYAGYALTPPGTGLPGGLVAAWIGASLIPPTFWAHGQVFLLFTDGRLPSPRWRPFAWAFAVSVGLGTLASAFIPGNLPLLEVPNPFALEVEGLAKLQGVFEAFTASSMMIGFLASAGSMVARFRRAGVLQRQQLKLVMYPAGVSALVWTAFVLTQLPEANRAYDWLAILGSVSLIGVPVGATIAILRHRLFDIDLLIRRSVVYGGLWLLIGVAYVGITAVLGIAAGDRVPMQLAVAVTIAATLLFQPLRRRVDQLARRLVFGERLSGYELVRRFGETLEHAYDVSGLAPRIAATVRDGLGARWARVALRFQAGDRSLVQRVGAAGIGVEEAVEPELSVVLTHAGEDVGVIECGPKAGGGFTERDRELLRTLGRQAALAIRNARLATELEARLDEIRTQAQEIRESRARIVHAQDAERRRIERNLHDGIQQEIVALKARLRLARNELRRDPDVADATLGELQGDVGMVIEELRELARGIHPPVLTDRGLVEAVQAKASALPIGVTIQASAELRTARFSEDIEGAAYFFVSEALTNVLKHAGANTATVHISSPKGKLRVEVSDDGVGFDPSAVSGSGLTGLRDRTDAVGGSFAVISTPGQGTRLIADLPARVQVRSDA